MTNTLKRNYWKKEEEDLLKQWADKAQCYQWMHTKSHNMYSFKNAMFTIPVIIISTITGTANFAQERFTGDTKTYVVLTIGTLSIIAGIITTIYQFLKIAELNEGHRVSSLSWGKFYRNIKTELTRHPLDRTQPLELIKISRDEYDRLVELSPIMPVKVISEFNSKFKNKSTLIKPEICDELSGTGIFQIQDAEREKLISELQSNKPKMLTPAEERKQKQLKKSVDEKTERFRQTFHSLNGRFPTPKEVKSSMSKYIYSNDSVGNRELDSSTVLSSNDSNTLQLGDNDDVSIEMDTLVTDNVMDVPDQGGNLSLNVGESGTDNVVTTDEGNTRTEV
jgi:hypothetical protein